MHAQQVVVWSVLRSFGAHAQYGIHLVCRSVQSSLNFVVLDLIDNHGSGYLGMARWFNVHR